MMPQDATQEHAAPLRTESKLAEESFLSDEFLRQLINVGEVDILVGLPTHNNARTVGPIVQSIQSGILKWFPRERVAIINADGGSRDGTPDLVAAASIDDVRHASLYTLRTLHSITTQYASSPDIGSALRTILSAAELLRARACAVISPESAGVAPDWLPTLLRPVCNGEVDLLMPTYRRHKFDGLLMTQLLYPMTRALYGAGVREPYASEFGIAGSLGSEFLAQNSWTDATARAGCEVRMVISAITGRHRIGQAFLGNKEHVERRGSDLVPAMRQTVGALFSMLEPTFSFWSAATPQAIRTIGPEHEVGLEPLRINRKRLYDMFSTGVSELASVFQSILSAATLEELRRIAGLGEDQFRYPAELWVKTVYEFAASYRRSVINRDHIIQALAPLFRGRVFTFLVENRNASGDGVETHIEGLCLEFERLKPYLLQLWNGRE